MDDASALGPSRYGNGRFGPGNPGKPRGARNRMSQRIALSLLRHFEQHEAEILEKLNSWTLFPVYMRLIERMLPQGAVDEEPDIEPLPAQETVLVTGAVRAALERVEAGEGSLAEVQDALAGL